MRGLSRSRRLARLFTHDSTLVPIIASYLRINALAEPLLAVAIVLRGALQGAGETRMPAWITFVTNWAIRLPFEWLLAVKLGYGAFGAWIAMSATTALSGLAMAAWFRWGNWRLEVRS